jgi:hypothetical protein
MSQECENPTVVEQTTFSVREFLQRFAPPALWSHYEQARDALEKAPPPPLLHYGRVRDWQERDPDHRQMMMGFSRDLQKAVNDLWGWAVDVLVKGEFTAIFQEDSFSGHGTQSPV